MYLSMSTYANYGRLLLPEITNASFEPIYNSYERTAESIVNWYTFNRLKKDFSLPVDSLETTEAESVYSCMAELIDLIATKQKAFVLGNNADGSGNAAVVSQSNDGVSISFNTLSASQVVDKYADETKQIIQFHLSDVKNSDGRRVLYKGLYSGE